MAEHRFRRSLLAQLALFHKQHPAAYLPREGHLVGDDHHRHPLVRQLPHDLQHLPHHFGVQRAGRLIEQHDLRFHGQRPHNGDPLLLPAGKLGRVGSCTVRESHPTQKLHCLLLGLLFFHPLDVDGRHGQVLQHRLVGKQIKVLEHHPHLLPVAGQIHLFAGDLHPIHQDGAGGGSLQQVQTAQEGAFAAAGGSDHGDYFSFADIHRYAIQRADCAAVVVFFQVLYLDDLLRHLSHGSFPL